MQERKHRKKGREETPVSESLHSCRKKYFQVEKRTFATPLGLGGDCRYLLASTISETVLGLALTFAFATQFSQEQSSSDWYGDSHNSHHRIEQLTEAGLSLVTAGATKGLYEHKGSEAHFCIPREDTAATRGHTR